MDAGGESANTRNLFPAQRPTVCVARGHALIKRRYSASYSRTCRAHGRRIVIVEYATRAAPAARIEVLDGVRKAPGIAHNGNRAIPQTVHLIEPTGLIVRGHEKNIAPCFNEMRERLVEAGVETEAIGIAPRQTCKKIGIFRI